MTFCEFEEWLINYKVPLSGLLNSSQWEEVLSKVKEIDEPIKQRELGKWSIAVMTGIMDLRFV